MKKFILTLTVLSAIGYGLSQKTTSEVKTGESKEVTKTFRQAVKQAEQKIVKAEAQEEATFPAPSLEDLEENFEHLETEELKKEYDKLVNSKAKASLIARANSGKLTEKEEAELKTYLRSTAALSKILMDRKFEEMEAL